MTTEQMNERLAALGTLDFAEDFDAAFYRLYLEADRDQRQQLRQLRHSRRVAPPRRFRNPGFPCRVDIRTSEQLRQATTFAVMTESSPDVRDDLVELAWHYHTARLFGMDPEEYFSEMEAIASPYMATVLRQFRLWPADEKAIEHSRAFYVADSPQGKYIEYRA